MGLRILKLTREDYNSFVTGKHDCSVRCKIKKNNLSEVNWEGRSIMIKDVFLYTQLSRVKKPQCSFFLYPWIEANASLDAT